MLTAFGRAYGRLPDDHGTLSRDQDDLPGPGHRRAGPGRQGHLGPPGSVRRDGQGEALDPGHAEGGRRHRGRRRHVPRRDLRPRPRLRASLHQKAAQAVLKALLPESGTDIKGQMRSHEELLEASGYAEPPQGLRRPAPHPRPRASPDHADRPGRLSKRGSARPRRAETLLPTHPRLPGSLAAGLADPQAAGDPPRTGGTAAGGTLGALERQAREPPPAVRPGMGEHPAADEEEGLDRAAAQDDETGGAGAWAADAGRGCWSGCPGHCSGSTSAVE